MKRPIAKRRGAAPDLPGLARVLPEIQSLIEASRQHVVSTANLTLVWLYWNVGRVITEDIQQHPGRADYGEQLLQSLATRLTEEYGKGYSISNLWDMRRFFEAFQIPQPLAVESSARPIRPPAAAKSEDRLTIDFSKHSHLGWTHYRILLSVEAGLKRGFYFQQAATHRWSKRELRARSSVPCSSAWPFPATLAPWCAWKKQAASRDGSLRGRLQGPLPARLPRSPGRC